jgi:hypothetical protein
VCNACRGGLRADLSDIPWLYRRLANSLVLGSAAGQPRVAGTRPPPAPGTLDVLNLRGAAPPGSISREVLEGTDADTAHLLDQHGSVSIVGRLRAWEADIRDALGLAAPVFHGSVTQSVAYITAFLLRNVDRICDNHPAAAGFLAEVAQLRTECRALLGEGPRFIKLGPCPLCGKGLRVDPQASALTCAGCGETWRRRDWVALAQAVEG